MDMTQRELQKFKMMVEQRDNKTATKEATEKGETDSVWSIWRG